jgi:urease accessory protein
MNMRSISSPRALARLASLSLLLMPTLCLAHSDDDGSGFMAGLLHPVFGFDHLLAMVAVGIISAQMGGANIWRVPLAFVGAMVFGGLVGIFGVPMPLREMAIAASVICLGGAIVVVQRSTSPYIPFFLVALFGMCHGHAHGVEMPESASPAFYTFGFLISTCVLHLAGVLIGEVAKRRDHLWSGLRYAGASMAGVGVMFLVATLRGGAT